MKKKEYKVYARSTAYYETTVKATSEEEAIDIARELDGGQFSELDPWGGEWQITSAEIV